MEPYPASSNLRGLGGIENKRGFETLKLEN